MIDTNKAQYGGQFSGFANKEKQLPFSAAYGGGTITSGHYNGPIRATLALDNANDISHVMVRFTGVETFYRVLDGTFQADYPNRASRRYSIEVFSYYKGGLLYVDAYVIWQSEAGPGSASTPAFTMDCLASLYQTPTRVG